MFEIILAWRFERRIIEGATEIMDFAKQYNTPVNINRVKRFRSILHRSAPDRISDVQWRYAYVGMADLDRRFDVGSFV